MFSSSTLTVAAFQAPRTLGELTRTNFVVLVLVAFVARGVIKMRRATPLRIPKALRAMKNDI
jgi:hypothetical protein